MRLTHLESLRPHCLICRQGRDVSQLKIEVLLKQAGDHVLEGILRCSNPGCQYEYPIIDGIPIIVPNPRDFIGNNAEFLMSRDDLDPVTLSLLRDCEGPQGSLNQVHQQLSSYGWCHYGDLDSANGDPEAGSTASLIQSGGEFSDDVGPLIDIGCSLGRATFELAQASSQLTLGIDLNLSFLRMAAMVLRSGQVNYPLRRGGIVYDPKEFPVKFEHSEMVDFWCCDAHDLPFADQTFQGAVSLNTLDSVWSPVGLMQSLARVTGKGAKAWIACPYDWSGHVTPVESWIGGHSQRAAHQGHSPGVFKEILMDPGHRINCWKILDEQQDLPWVIRNHDRSRTLYSLHALLLEKTEESGA